jgi:hypothetical protein
MEDNVLHFMQIMALISFLISLIFIGKILFFYFVTIKSWKNTEAIITHCEMEWFRSEKDSDHEGWKQNIKYEYFINNVKYENDCVTKNIIFLSPFKDFAKKYSFAKGQKIEIFYNPINPKKSIIDSKFNFLTMLIPIAFYAICLFFLK